MNALRQCRPTGHVWRLLLGVGFVGLLAIVALPAMAQIGNDPDARTDGPVPPRSSPTAAADPAATRALGVLRRDRNVRDRTWAADKRAVQPLGANYDLARFARKTASGEGLYLVPGRGVVCMASDANGVQGCTLTDVVVQGQATGTDICTDGLARDRIRVWGIVLDGVSSIRVELQDGSATQWSVEGNMYAEEIPKQSPGVVPTRGSYEDTDGDRVQVQFVVPADASTTVCE